MSGERYQQTMTIKVNVRVPTRCFESVKLHCSGRECDCVFVRQIFILIYIVLDFVFIVYILQDGPLAIAPKLK